MDRDPAANSLNIVQFFLIEMQSKITGYVEELISVVDTPSARFDARYGIG